MHSVAPVCLSACLYLSCSGFNFVESLDPETSLKSLKSFDLMSLPIKVKIWAADEPNAVSFRFTALIGLPLRPCVLDWRWNKFYTHFDGAKYSLRYEPFVDQSYCHLSIDIGDADLEALYCLRPWPLVVLSCLVLKKDVPVRLTFKALSFTNPTTARTRKIQTKHWPKNVLPGAATAAGQG